MRAIATLFLITGVAFPAPVPKAISRLSDEERFVGVWDTVVSEINGNQHTKARWSFDSNLKMTSSSGGSTWTIKLDPNKLPREIDITDYKGIYEFNGDEIKIAYTLGAPRPIDFTAAPGKYYCVLRRVPNDAK
jgi:uncharacterized protein (TIGR03067 family)